MPIVHLFPLPPVLRRLLVALVLLCAVSPAHALDRHRLISQYVHDVWTTTEGLPQDSVNAITQTKDGYLWVATQEGLARFNGAAFTSFDSRTTHGRLENFVHTLHASPDGSLWVGASGTLLRYDGGQRFIPGWDPGKTSLTSPRTIAEEPDGTLWIGMGNDGTSGSKGLVRFRGRIEAILRTSDGLSSDVVSGVAVGRNGDLWAATANGLDLLRNGRVVRTYHVADGLASEIVDVVLVDRGGAVWAGTAAGLSCLRDGRFTTYTTRNGLADDSVHRLLEDRDGALWIGTNQGLSRLAGGVFDTARQEGIAGSRILSLYEDREGSIWVGVSGGGLHRFRAGKFIPFGTTEGLLGNNVNGVLEDAAGRIWAGVTPGGVNIVDGTSITALPPTPSLATGGKVLHQDADGTMWIGTREGLNRIAHGVVTTWTARDGLPDVSVEAITRDRHGVLWIGTGHGPARFEGDRIVAVPRVAGFPSSTSLIYEDRKGRLWFGGGEGLAWWDGRAFHVDPQFVNAHVVSVYEDRDGTLWFGTWGQGLHRYRDGRLTVINTDAGLDDDVAWSVLDDGIGNLWMGGNRGIYAVAKRQLEAWAAHRLSKVTCVSYGTADGLRKRETNLGNPAAIRARDGRFWYGTTGGLAVIDPRHIVRNPVPPPVVIERISGDDRDFAATVPPRFAAGTRNIEFDYAALSFVAPGRVRYRYRLEGEDEPWTDAGSRRVAYYTRLPPGDYRFRVIAANEDGVWNEVGATVTFRVEPFFWQTGGFYALVAGALVLMILGAFRLRERQRRIRYQALHDPLTGLPNRRVLHRRAAAAINDAPRSGRTIALMFIDLDGFKQVNDRLGHDSGDRLLTIVAARLRTCIRAKDVLARIGGDEFAVLVVSSDPAAAATEIGERMIASVREPLRIDEDPARIGVSIGVAVFPIDGRDFRSLLQAADRAMYDAKKDGGNRCRFAGANLEAMADTP